MPIKSFRQLIDFLTGPVSPTGPVFSFLIGHVAVYRETREILAGPPMKRAINLLGIGSVLALGIVYLQF